MFVYRRSLPQLTNLVTSTSTPHLTTPLTPTPTAGTMLPSLLRLSPKKPPAITSTLAILRRSRTHSTSSPSDGSSRRVPPMGNATGAVVHSNGTATRARSVPFVPSTGHLKPVDIAVSAFFALHRPINIEPMMEQPEQQERGNERTGPPQAWENGLPFVPPPPPAPAPSMNLISVKRQRKLKMKKHKYKKLMKKTRNLRRRIERQRS